MARRGYTLIELLVTLAVVAVLVGLFLSAVQQVRATAARLRCANHLKQVALAAHLYHDRAGRFPPGCEGEVRRPAHRFENWQTKLLPDLDQGPAWDRAAADYAANPNPFRGTPAHANRDRVVSVLTCPADARTATAWELNHFGQVGRYAHTSYLGNAGTSHRRPDGVLYLASRTNVLAITDGASNTLFAGERPPSADLIYGWWYAGAGQDLGGSLDSTLGVREVNRARPWYRACGRGPFAYRAGRADDHCAAFHFWSLHAGGANFAFADGGVRFLAYSADTILPALATRAGGETVAVPD